MSPTWPRTVGGAETILANTTVPGLSVNPNDVLRTRFVVSGSPNTTVSAKVWRKGTQEPTAWLLTNTSATPAQLQAPGDIGVLVYVSGSWTGSAPTVALDNLKVDGDFGPPVNAPPVANFFGASQYKTEWFDASNSYDPDDGTIVGYAWDFGDGTTGTGVNPQHTYASGGTYTVTLTATDNGGASSVFSDSVAVEDPPPPSAFFTTSLTFVTASFDGTGSTDVDGTIASYAWNFGDGTTGTGATPDHTYTSGGIYTVTLVVTDNEGNTGSSAETIEVENPPPPTAFFSSSAQFLTVSFDGTGSSAASGSIASYAWDFGDGTTGTGATPQHTYATGGSYTVTLVVTDGTGQSSAPTTKTLDFTAAPPPTANFTSTSSYNTANLDGTSSSDVDGTITAWAWDFGDGTTGTGATPSHKYASGGTYSVTLVVTDNTGHQSAPYSANVTVTDAPPPTASFTATPTFLQVAFDGTGSSDVDGTIASYVWNFGDGNTGVGATPNHTYATGGTYVVQLVVTDNDGHQSAPFQTSVTVSGSPPPTASFTVGGTGLTADFDGSGSSDPGGLIVSYAWNFGDSATGTGSKPSHKYAAPGTYTVQLTVTDNDGNVASTTNPVTVAPAQYALDTFTRTTSNGLGTADTGGAWTFSGAASGYSVSGGQGQVLGASGGNRSAFLLGVRQTEVDLTTDVGFDVAPTGGGAYVSVTGRRVSSGNDYHVKLRFQAGGSVVAYLARNVGGVETVLATRT